MEADLYIPQGWPRDLAYERTTHLGIGAHQDDLEFMALHGILACYDSADRWFGGVICTDGAGSARTGSFAEVTGEQMREIRREEQRAAARIGQYSFIWQFPHTSVSLKARETREPLVREIEEILREVRPTTLYTHNPLDKHPTHITTFLAVLEALRRLPQDALPREIWGCEGWRGLDWLEAPGAGRVALDVSARPELARRLNAQFASQIAGGKRYDRAVEGRWAANATFDDAHTIDTATRVSYALDLRPLLDDPKLDPLEFALGKVAKLAASVQNLYSALSN